MAEEIVRLYSMEDGVMLERAKVQQDLLDEDLTLFTAKFPWIDAAWVAGYLADIETADEFPEDGTVMTNMKLLTNNVNAAMQEGISALKMLFIYSETTYPNDKVSQRMFGQDRMEKARKDQKEMENLLEHANTMANGDPQNDELIAKGYTQLQIDGLLTISDNISTKNKLQEKAKAKRPVTTQQRIKVMNTVFADRMRTIATCAQAVFMDDQAKIIQYRAYPPSSGAATKANVHIVNPSNANMENLNVSIDGDNLITDIGGMAGPFELGTDPPDNIDVTVSGAGIDPATQTFNFPVLDGEVNLFEIEVTV